MRLRKFDVNTGYPGKLLHVNMSMYFPYVELVRARTRVGDRFGREAAGGAVRVCAAIAESAGSVRAEIAGGEPFARWEPLDEGIHTYL
jgi:hypothetical protein